MNYLSKIILCCYPFLCTATLFSAYIMDSGRMNNNSSGNNGNYYDNGQLAYNGVHVYPEGMDSRPVPQDRRYYRYPAQRMYSPDPTQPPQFNMDTYPYEPTDYNNKNRRWVFDPKSTEESPWIADNQASKQTLRQHHPLSDDGISQQLRHTIKRDPMLSSFAKKIEVEVNRGNITLTGNVQTQKEKNKIDYIANSIDGVKSVKNKIKIESQE